MCTTRSKHLPSSLVTSLGVAFMATNPAMSDKVRIDPSGNSFPCCHGASTTDRNLIVCIDGTSNEFGDKNTNVIELYNLLLKDPKDRQLTWYNSGIGTFAPPSQTGKIAKFLNNIRNIPDLLFATNFQRTVLGAYRWLSDNYQPGDRIFLFGFSRGAFQVRVLAAMIDKVGLIYRGNEMQIPFAYNLYIDPTTHKEDKSITAVGEVSPLTEESSSSSSEDGNVKQEEAVNRTTPRTTSKAERFKKAFSQKDVHVHFVGAWDTVMSVGLIRDSKMFPGTLDGMKHVCFFRHALALDERRVKFLPEYAYGGTSIPVISSTAHYLASIGGLFVLGLLDNPQVSRHPSSSDNHNTQHREETVILQPVTIDVEGTIPPKPRHEKLNTGSIDDLPKKKRAKMTKEAGEIPHTKEVWFPGTHSDVGGGNRTNDNLDRSRPPLRWMVNEAGKLGLRTAMFERELSSKEQVEIMESLSGLWWILEWLPIKRLTFTQKIGGKVVTRRPHRGTPRKIHVGQKIHSSLLLGSAESSSRPRYVPKALPFPHAGESESTAGEFWVRLGEHPEWLELDLYDYLPQVIKFLVYEDKRGMSKQLKETATWNQGRQAVYDEGIYFLQTEQGLRTKHQYTTIFAIQLALEHGSDIQLRSSDDIRSLCQELLTDQDERYKKTALGFLLSFSILPEPRVIQGHTGSVLSIAFLKDGKEIVTCSSDSRIRFWDAQSVDLLRSPIHVPSVLCIALSPNGTFIASGLKNGRIKIHDVYTGQLIIELPLGHQASVNFLAFSPDGKKLVSCSDDRCVRVWNSATGEPITKFSEHDNCVLSVSVSPNGKRIVSGSLDGTVRVWDIKSGRKCGELRSNVKHSDSMWSVTFSHDGKRIASASHNKTIKIWDVETGKAVVDSLRGHTGPIKSIAFSPDSRLLVSGSRDHTVRIWDTRTGNQIGVSLRGHIGSVSSVSFSPDGRQVVSASDDKTARVWDVEDFLALSKL